MIYLLICEVIQKLSAKSLVNHKESCSNCENVILFRWMQFSITHKVCKDHVLYLLCRGSSRCACTQEVSVLHSFSLFLNSVLIMSLYGSRIFGCTACDISKSHSRQEKRRSVQGLLSLFAFSQQVVNK